MALNVGELNALMTVDDRAVNPALRRAEHAMRDAGQQMADDAERAGHEAGQQLGDGLADGADEGGRGLNDRLGGHLDKLKGLAAGAGVAAGAAVGAMLVDSFSQAMDQGQITAKMTAGLNATPAEAKRLGQAAGSLYKHAVVENFQEGADAIGTIARAGLAPPDATVAQLATIGTKVADLSSKYEEETGAIARAAKKMLVTGMAGSATEAFDLIAKGFETSANQGDDFLDTLNEYSVQFKRVGLDGKTAIGLIDQAIDHGARDSDQVADAIGQFGERATAGGSAVVAAFQSIGVNADDVKKKLQKGGKSGQEALQMTTDALRNTTDKQTRLNAAAALFGDPANVMGDALYALDPASAAASSGMDKAKDSAGKLGDGLRDNAASKITAFKNSLQQNVVEFLGTHVIPALTDAQGAVSKTFGGLWAEAAKGAGGSGVDQFINLFPLLGKRIVQKVGELAPQMIGALTGAGETVAAWVVANPTKVLKIAAIAAAITLALVSLPLLAGAAITSSAAMIMLGFGKKLVEFLIQNVPAWWTAFTGWVSSKASQAGTVMTVLGAAIGLWFASLWSRYISDPVSRAWNSFITTVRGLPGRATGALASLGASLAARASSAWTSFHNATAKKVLGFISYVRGLPGRISGAIGSLSGLLTQKGRNVVQGLWSGIVSMGGWIKSKIIGWAKDVIPGPIAKALGIASPSKVTKAQGRWIARGLVDGLTGSGKQVRAASTKLADIIADSLAPGRRRSKALGTLGAGTKKLLKLAGQEEKLAARLKTASKKLADQVKARDALAASVSKGVLEGGDITKQDTDGWPQTAETILAGLKQDTAAAQAFAKNLAQLRKKGVRADLISQIAQAGVDQGSAAAAALANANSGQIKEINSQQKSLVSAANQAGAVAGDAMYGAGINAARGLIKGLQSQQKAIERQMLTIAKGMSKSIRAALGIKSPSKVMALVGAYTAQGLRKGIESERAAVNRSMASLVDTQSPVAWASGAGAGVSRPVQATKVVLELHSSGRGEDNYLVERMRRGVRMKGGSAQSTDFVMTGRRRTN